MDPVFETKTKVWSALILSCCPKFVSVFVGHYWFYIWKEGWVGRHCNIVNCRQDCLPVIAKGCAKSKFLLLWTAMRVKDGLISKRLRLKMRHFFNILRKITFFISILYNFQITKKEKGQKLEVLEDWIGDSSKNVSHFYGVFWPGSMH